MKNCPFCAEEIQDAAIVCKHCQRELSVPVAAPRRWGRIVLIAGAVVALPIVMLYCGEDHQRFLKFAAERDAWHRKCDVYRTTRVASADAPAALACQQELDALTAYAKQQGW